MERRQCAPFIPSLSEDESKNFRFFSFFLLSFSLSPPLLFDVNRPHRAKAKAKIFFDVCCLFFNHFCFRSCFYLVRIGPYSPQTCFEDSVANAFLNLSNRLAQLFSDRLSSQ